MNNRLRFLRMEEFQSVCCLTHPFQNITLIELSFQAFSLFYFALQISVLNRLNQRLNCDNFNDKSKFLYTSQYSVIRIVLSILDPSCDHSFLNKIPIIITYYTHSIHIDICLYFVVLSINVQKTVNE